MYKMYYINNFNISLKSFVEVQEIILTKEILQ